jgi:hypothetical protein
MCTMTVAQEILGALQARIANGSVFSAYDVTTDARDRTKENVSHREVRDIVHNEWITGQFPANYKMDVIELDVPNNPRVVVYFPDGKSASDHPKALKVDNSQAAPATDDNEDDGGVPLSSFPGIPASSVSNWSHPTSTLKLGGHTKVGDTYVCNVTAEGRVTIPKQLLSKIQPVGGTYDVSFMGRVLYYQPNGDGRVRIAQSRLDDSSKFKVSVDVQKNLIMVEQV